MIDLKLIQNRFAWEVFGSLIEISEFNMIQKRFYYKNNMIVALIGDNINTPEFIVGYSVAGELLFKSTAPYRFSFSYLCEHPQVDIAVVCGVGSGEDNIYTWREYFFGVDPQKGTLTKIGVAR